MHLKKLIPTVSVIVTTCNSERSIQRLLDSLFSQQGLGISFQIELIVVDDCSSDSTLEILASNKVDYLSTSYNSGGPNRGRNIGLKKVAGDYICIADHDDEWHSNKLLSQLQYIKSAPIVTSGYTLIDTIRGGKTDRINSLGGSSDFLKYDENCTFLSHLTRSKKGQQAYIGSILYNAELKDILFEEHFGMVDFDWVLKLFHRRKSVEVCRSLYNRYVSAGNLSLNPDYRAVDFYYSLITVEKYEDQYRKEARIASKRIYGSRARYFYLMDNMPKARAHFIRAGFSLKIILYYLTSYFGSGFVKKRFNVFG